MEGKLMGTQEKMEREINLLELFWRILFSWRQIICLGVIFAIIFGGIKYALDLRVYRSNMDVTIESVEEKLTDEELEDVTRAKELRERIDTYQDYLNTSIVMQINPYEKTIVELQYYVQSDYMYNYTENNQRDYTNDLMTLYYNYIRGGEISQSVKEAADVSMSQADVSELISVSISGTSMGVIVTCPEEEKLEEIAEVLKSHLSEKEKELQKIGSHKLVLLNESQNVIADTALMDRKNTISTNITTLNSQFDGLKANMTEQQLRLLETETEEKDDKGNEKELALKPSISKKYILLGGIFGIFLVCAWIVCKMVFTARLQNSEEIRTLFSIRLFGEIMIPAKKKPFLNVFDEKLLAVKNRKKKELSLEQQIKVVSANIALSCKQQNVSCIYLTGSEYENVDGSVLNLLKQELSVQNIQIKEGGNIFYDAESMKQGTEIGNILFVEQVGLSIYDEVFNELNLAKEQCTTILGAVVLA